MKRVTAVLLFILSTASAWSAVGPPEDAKPDARLEQPVTIECLNVRLHTAMEMISEQTGVRLNCGRNKDDWQVRDIPVTLITKDLPLGKLLQTLADVTHMALTSDKIESGRSYRIWQDRKHALELTDYIDKMHAWGDDMARWRWDAMCKFRDIPASAIAGVTNTGVRARLASPLHRQLSEIVTLLGVGTRDRAMAGETIRISQQDATGRLKTLLGDYFQGCWQSAYDFSRSRGDTREWTTPTSEEFEKVTLVIRCSDPSATGERYINCYAEGNIQLRSEGLGIANIMDRNLKDYGLPKRPEQPRPPRVDNERTHEFWSQSISIEPPKGKEPLIYADLFAAVAKATGYSLVMEDFCSHRQGDVRNWFNRAVTPAEGLSLDRLAWTDDAASKLLIGSEREWTTTHLNMVPASVLDNLKRKLNGEGVELDDVTPMAYWTPEQQREWIYDDRDLHDFGAPLQENDQPVWAFYYSLSPAQKAQAMSEQGLILGTTDVPTLCTLFSERNRKRGPGYVRTTGSQEAAAARSARAPATRTMSEIPIDPLIVANMVMHVRTQDYPNRGVPGTHRYFVEITWQAEPRSLTMQLAISSMAFPKYSQKREKELFPPTTPAAPPTTGR